MPDAEPGPFPAGIGEGVVNVPDIPEFQDPKHNEDMIPINSRQLWERHVR